MIYSNISSKRCPENMCTTRFSKHLFYYLSIVYTFNIELKVRHYFKKNLVRLLVQAGRGEGCALISSWESTQIATSC